jgi:hypothetical protein
VIPGTIKFVRPEIDELKANISSKDENGKVVLFKPTGELEVALAPTDDQEIVEFNIIKLKAYTNSYEVLGESDLPPLILFTGKRPLLRNHFLAF